MRRMSCSSALKTKQQKQTTKPTKKKIKQTWKFIKESCEKDITF
jgi:hypothetical protein